MEAAGAPDRVGAGREEAKRSPDRARGTGGGRGVLRVPLQITASPPREVGASIPPKAGSPSPL